VVPHSAPLRWAGGDSHRHRGADPHGREARLDPGEGGIDLAAIVHRIPQVPYSLEIPHLERVKAVGYKEHARLCCANARKYLAAHPRCQPTVRR
jgi:sugar phosphate isomerase/epimerase